MAGRGVDSDLYVTVMTYVLAVYGETPTEVLERAMRLAASNSHSAIQESFALLGAVEVLTDEDAGDVSCVYRVSDSSDLEVEVYISTVMPYAAALTKRSNQVVMHVGPTDVGLPGSVAESLSAHGVVLLSPDIWRSLAPLNVGMEGGVATTLWELLFEREMDVP
jgi:hypothetical protein